MAQLPDPNMNAFDIILDTCHRIAANSNENHMDSTALAEILVPCLIWRQTRVKSNPAKVLEMKCASLHRAKKDFDGCSLMVYRLSWNL